MHMGHERIPKQALEWETDGMRRKGRPKKTFISNVKVTVLNRDQSINDQPEQVYLAKKCF